MLADGLMKDGKDCKDMMEAIHDNIFRMSRSVDNMVMYEKGEHKIVNRWNKSGKEEEESHVQV